jgi:hypothetical protein
VLHVHHIKPWGEGGLTEEENLITLCHTCHIGLEPHYEEKLYSLIDVPWLGLKSTEENYIEYIKGLKNYQKISINLFLNRNKKRVKKPSTKKIERNKNIKIN